MLSQCFHTLTLRLSSCLLDSFLGFAHTVAEYHMPIWRFFCCYFRRLLANTAIKQGCKKESWILLKCILSLVLFSVTLVFTAALHAHGGGDLVISLSIIFIRKAYSCCRCDSEHSAIGTMFCFSENAAYC